MMDNNQESDQMEEFMNRQIDLSDGKFCVENLTFNGCTWSLTDFRKFLKTNVRNDILSAEKDEYGRVWYSRK